MSPLLDLMQDVLLANLMSRILLKRVGEGVPVRVQQLAGARCWRWASHYGLDKETAQTLVQNLIEVVVVKRQVGLIMGAVAWHFPESYLNAMEYYPVSTHALEPTTRNKKTKPPGILPGRFCALKGQICGRGDEPSQSPLRSTALPKGEPLAKRAGLVLIGQLLEETIL